MLFNKRKISVNIIFSIIQIIASGLGYFLTYKIILKQVGSELMGVWAIVLSVSSTANIASLGIGSSVVRFTAKFRVNQELDKITRLVHTSVLFLGSVTLLVLALIYLISPFWLRHVLDARYLDLAFSLIPVSLLTLFLNALSNVFFSCIDGFQKNFLRSLMIILSSVILVVLTYFLSASYGLFGVVLAQLGQAAFMLVSSIICLKYIHRNLTFFPLHWDKQIFRGIFSIGVQEQVISLSNLLFDPLTKSMLGRFGDLSFVGYYEMANRLILQLRGLIVGVSQVFIPVFSEANEQAESAMKKVYSNLFQVNYLLSLLWLTTVLSTVVAVSLLWIGQVNSAFIGCTIILSVGYWLNINMNPSYFANIGTGVLYSNVVSNLIIALVNVVFGLLLGYFLGSYGVIMAWSLGLACGSIYVMHHFHKKLKISIHSLLTRTDIYLSVCCLLLSVTCFYFFFKTELSLSGHLLGSALALLLICVLIALTHPLPKTLLQKLRNKHV